MDPLVDNFVCGLCGFYNIIELEVRCHIRVFHGGFAIAAIIPLPQPQFQTTCRACPQTFTDLVRYQEHLVGVHGLISRPIFLYGAALSLERVS